VKIKNFISEVSIWFKQVFHIKNCWILLPALIAVLLVYAVHNFNTYPWLITRDFNENIALYLVSMIFVLLLTKSLISRDLLMIFLTILALVFFIREFHDTVFTFFGSSYQLETKKLVYCLLVGMGIWAFVWHEKLFTCLNRSIMLKVSLFGVLWTYLFSQLIARRVFRGILPNERLLHIPLEETAETFAHLFFILFALFCFLYYNNKKDDYIKP
jgi:hypothetical protein